jgi:hypothetical protein
VLCNSGYVRIYDSTIPADADTAVGAQVLLAELRFNATAFGAAVAGVITANAITADASANAAGTASWFRALKSDGTTVLFDGTVGTATSNMILNTTTISVGLVVSCSSLTITISKATAGF